MARLRQFPLLQLWVPAPVSADVRAVLPRMARAILWMDRRLPLRPLRMTHAEAGPLRDMNEI